jgi:hypothetical protein
MSWNIGEHRYPQLATFWSLEDKGTYAVVKLGTSSKDKEGNWHNSTWSFVRFVGKAYNNNLLNLEEKDRIEILSGKIDREPYTDKDGNRAWAKNEKITVFAWKKYVPEDRVSESESNETPVVEEEDDGKLPF